MKSLFRILILIALLVFLGAIFFGILPKKGEPSNISFSPSFCFKGNCLLLEVAQTPQELEKGLMYREKLDKDKGMLFVFGKEDIYPFWMKNTLIPLDMVWMDADKKIVFIAQDVQPCKTTICQTVVPLKSAKYVLEVNSGICQELGLKMGDELKISL